MRESRRPFTLSIALALVGVASLFVPARDRTTWRAQWRAEVMHYGQARPGGAIRWALGAFRHAWDLIRTEFSMDSIWQDVRFSLRSLRRGIGIVSVAVISLALGIGATATIFAAVDVFMFRPLPVPDEDQVLMVFTTNAERGWSRTNFSGLDFVDLRERSTTLNVAATVGNSFNLSGGDRPERVRGARASWNLFDVMGFEPTRGRGFFPEEEAPGAGNVAVISDGLWHRTFGADPTVLGTTILLDDVPHEIVGVLPEDFWFMNSTIDIWAPLTINSEESRASRGLNLMARLNDSVELASAKSEIERLGTQLGLEHPDDNNGNSARAVEIRGEVFDEGFRIGSAIVSVAVAFLLLITCANVANLLLTRSAGRDREIAVRGALGAGRRRIIRQFLTESLLIAGLGGIGGVGAAWLGIRGLLTIMPADMPRVEAIGLDARVIGFTAIITVVTGLLFGLMPAIQGTRANITESLKEGGHRGATGARGGRLRKSLVVVEVSLAVTLLVASALLVQSYRALSTTDLGFDPSDVLTFRVTVPVTTYPDSAAVVRFVDAVDERLHAIPGVTAVGATNVLPDLGNVMTFFSVTGEEERSQRPVESFRSVLPEYFDAFDVDVVQGRAFAETDRADAPRVVMVNETFVERYWPADVNPVGQLIHFTRGPAEVVGVTRSIRDFGGDSDMFPMMYLNARQGLPRSLSWMVESTAPVDVVTRGAREAIAAIDPNLPLASLATMQGVLDAEIAADRVMPDVMSALAVIALVLSLAGVYGVMAYSVSQRVQEMGIRMALGAAPTRVLSLIVRQGAILAIIGVTVGVGLGLLVMRGLAFFLVGVSPFHLPTFGVVAVTLLAASIAAAFIPALRATRVHPVTALRAE